MIQEDEVVWPWVLRVSLLITITGEVATVYLLAGELNKLDRFIDAFIAAGV